MAATSALAEDLRTATRWPALDGVRGVALLAVVLYHGVRLAVLGEAPAGTRDVQPLWWPAGTARFALDAFFVLSGFLVVGSWSSMRRRHGRLWPAAREYAARRAARILPAYWVSLVILIPLVAPHLLRQPGKLGLLASVQQYVLPGLPSEVNVVYWSLTTEVHFYVVAPLVAVLLGRFAGWRVVLGCAAVTVAWRLTLPAGLAPSLVFGRLEQFAVGAAAADVVRLHHQGQPPRIVAALQRRGVGVALATTLVALGVYQGAVIDGVGLGAATKLLHPAVAILMAALFVRLLTSGRRSALEHPALRLAGLVSYGTYLFHYPVLELGLRALSADAGSGAHPIRALAAVLALSVASCVIGAVSYVVVERRFLRLREPVAERHRVIDLREHVAEPTAAPAALAARASA